MRSLLHLAIWIIILTVFTSSMFTVAHRINEWETANNYPYGKLCDLYNNC